MPAQVRGVPPSQVRIAMATVTIAECSLSDLAEYCTVPIAFTVTSRLDGEVVGRGRGGIVMIERPVAAPYVKDYDAFEGGLVEWAGTHDLSKWGVIAAPVDGALVGGCVIAFDTPGILRLEGRSDIAALWDLRVHLAHRRSGIGTALFGAAVRWAEQRQCRLFKVETQNINVPACRFYAKQGCTLGYINRFAYTEFPEEVELGWCRQLP
jgi:GNAT superfamily N-acetyltransferase